MILVFTDWFTPAFKAGGPIRSIVNIVERYKSSYDIHVFTSDRDLNDEAPFDVQTDQWIEKEGYRIYYHSPGKMTFKKVKEVIAEINPDKIYLNSMFSNMILPILAAARTGKIILAPRGMLRQSALSNKPFKKQLYLFLIRILKLEKNITFHSTSKEETNDIKRIFPKAKRVVEAQNLPVSVSQTIVNAHKNCGELKIIFVGRLHPIKNLMILLESLQEVKGDIALNIVATRDDHDYWKACKKTISILQPRIDVNVSIAVPHHKIKPILETSHLFVLPTKGENFGHAIFESLAVGCPVLISNQTPWRDLHEFSAGMDLPLVDNKLFVKAIQQFVDMGDVDWQKYRQGAHLLARSYENSLLDDGGYSNLFS